MTTEQLEVIGGEKNFWLYSKTDGFDLTHPPTPTSSHIHPRLLLETTKARVANDPAKTALVVVDLQNYFLSPHLGRTSNAVGMRVVDELLEHAILTCRKPGIQIVWLNWGLTKQDIDEMLPTITEGFAADNNFDGPRRIKGLGSEIGPVQLGNNTVVDGGRVLMRDQWNSASCAPLQAQHQPHDMQIHKNRLSGFWGGTAGEEALTSRGIRTLLFAGANTDQCVGGSLQDAFAKGWDCLPLSDGCATTSPGFAKRCIEFNCEEAGASCCRKDLARGVGGGGPYVDG
ncbi:MAG: hypothetical protein M1839_004548 [Geoglossum umbratile]|nr:MAG: hypothetical protein M1839_004548 [Geoglossum umbratile]